MEQERNISSVDLFLCSLRIELIFKQTLLPTVLFVGLVPRVTGIWNDVATRLTKYENHRQTNRHEKSLTLKLLALNFLTAYGGLLISAYVYVSPLHRSSRTMTDSKRRFHSVISSFRRFSRSSLHTASPSLRLLDTQSILDDSTINSSRILSPDKSAEHSSRLESPSSNLTSPNLSRRSLIVRRILSSSRMEIRSRRRSCWND